MAADENLGRATGGIDLGQLEVVLRIDQTIQLQLREQLIQLGAALAGGQGLQLSFDRAAIRRDERTRRGAHLFGALAHAQ